MTEKLQIQRPGKRIKRWRWILANGPGDWRGETVWGFGATAPGSNSVTALEIEYEDESPLPKPFKPGKGDWYWYVIDTGHVMYTDWRGGEHYPSDEFRYRTGNCFRTEEEAEHHRDVALPHRELVARLQAAADGGNSYLVVCARTGRVNIYVRGDVAGSIVIAGPYKRNTAMAIFRSLTDDERELLERGEEMEVDDD